ncbi:hypothetical protein DV515_00011874 [Chloebia gouldiae]|uniref:Uncharacterized protein n=1 Tax=Chloebia gouldiae TaxID=44316 RepID=A0A3L8S5D0_CHLGU|nr:hypothetical protein DV515_00011874 [Chloebia gouldiae]
MWRWRPVPGFRVQPGDALFPLPEEEFLKRRSRGPHCKSNLWGTSPSFVACKSFPSSTCMLRESQGAELGQVGAHAACPLTMTEDQATLIAHPLKVLRLEGSWSGGSEKPLACLLEIRFPAPGQGKD